MLVNKAYKFRLYPNDEQKQLIDSFIGTARFIYNHYLYENKNNKYFNYFNVAKDVKKLKEEYPWLKEVDGCLIQNA